MSAPLIVAHQLVKSFGEFTAVKGIDVEVQPGEVFGFLGPNGAGKSSTMRMIACVSPVSGGTLRLFGMDPATHGPQIRARIGVVPQLDTLDTELSVQENLWIYGRFFDLPRAEAKRRATELLEFAQLSDRAGNVVETLSGGMKRRLSIARSLINNPELLLLDEPTTGLDPQARHVLWDRLYRLKQQGVTQVLTTHYMDEAEALCDRLSIMDHGKVIATGTPASLIADLELPSVVELTFEGAAPDPAAFAARLGQAVERRADLWEIPTPDPKALLPRLLESAESVSVPFQQVHIRRATLEDVFLHRTGRSLRE
jgi:ABC-type multidrug transport system ATPase subunit